MDNKNTQKGSICSFMMYEIVIAERTENTHSTISGSAALHNASTIFASLFEGVKLNLYRVKRGGEPEILQNDIMAVHDGIYLLRINNNKKTTMVEQADTTTNGKPDYEENTYISNPYCYVVIDNRPEKGICQMAIQKNSAWGDTGNVQKVLEYYFNREFLEHGVPLSVTLCPKMRPSRIWDFCKQRCEVGKDTITKISFEFPNQRKIATSNRISKPSGYIRGVAKLADLTNALKAHIELEYQSANPEDLEKNFENLAQIVRICTHDDYKLIVHFKEYGKYICDDMVKAMFPMKEQLLNLFMSDWEKESLKQEQVELFAWCDDVYEQSKLFEYAIETPAKQHR